MNTTEAARGADGTPAIACERVRARALAGWPATAARPAAAAIAFAVLAASAAAGPGFAQPRAAGSPAATLYALNCMGCHPAPKTRAYDAGPLRGEFFHNDKGRNFFIRMPAEGRALSTAEEARLLEEVLTWKRGCAAIRQDAPMVGYYGEHFVR
ncbi:MAG: hypothetical protein M9885_15000 [Burkholderiaceae bacterium]|nr:hypothetical protein [Burkholderiaceae bacterium]